MTYKGKRREQRECDTCSRSATYQLTVGRKSNSYLEAYDVCDVCLEIEYDDIDPPLVGELRPVGGGL